MGTPPRTLKNRADSKKFTPLNTHTSHPHAFGEKRGTIPSVEKSKANPLSKEGGN